MAKEACTGSEGGAGNAGTLHRVDTFTGDSVIHLQGFQLAEGLLLMSAEETVADAEDPGIRCMGASDFCNRIICKAVLVGRGTNHRNSIAPDLIVTVAESIVWEKL